jgi:hypothetical protein
MNITKINAEKKLSLVVNYNKVENTFSAEASLDPEEDAGVASSELNEYVKAQLNEMFASDAETLKSLTKK